MGKQDNEDDRHRRKEDEGWMTSRKRTARTIGILWRNMKLPHFCEPVALGLSKAAGWVTYEGVVPLVAEALKWRSTGRCRDRKAEVMARDPTNSTKWKHMWRFHNRGVVWYTPFAKWCGSGEEWHKKMQREKTPRIERSTETSRCARNHD